MEDARNFENEYPADILAIFTPSDTVLLSGGSESDGIKIIAIRNGTLHTIQYGPR